MAIYKSTRYENSEIVAIRERGERDKTFVYRGERFNKEDEQYDTVTQIIGEYFNIITAKELDSSLGYHKLCDLNDILDPFEIVEGRKPLLPPLT